MSRRPATWAVALAACSSACGSEPHLSSQPKWVVDDVAKCWFATAIASDVTGDGFEDVVVLDPDCSFFDGGSSTPSVLRLFVGDETGLQPEPVAIAELGVTGIEALLLRMNIFDADGDGLRDIHLHVLGEGRAYLSSAGPSAQFQSFVPAPAWIDFATDLDGIGGDEVFDGMELYYWEADTRQFSAPIVVPGVAVSEVGDLNGDGMGDIVIDTGAGLALRRGCRQSCADRYLGPEIPIELPGQPWSQTDANLDGRPDVALFTASGRLQIHATDEFGLPHAEPLWTLVPDPIDVWLGWPRGGFDVDGDRATDLIVTSGKRSLLFRGSDTGPERLPSWEWTTVSGRFSFIFARDFDRDGHADIVAIEYADTGARIAAYPGGLVTGARPEYPDGFSCQAHAGDLPDLGVDADALRRSVAIRREVFDADSCELAEQCIGAPGERRLLEFTASIQNFGGAPAELPGPSIAPDLYEFDACHDHHHLVGFASYELVDRDGLVVVAGHKQGYYLVDSVAYCDTAPREPPDSDVLWISPGWSDVYPAGLACQWIDITGVPDGDYQLRVRVNTDGTFEEDDQISNEGLVSVRIRGDEVVAGE